MKERRKRPRYHCKLRTGIVFSDGRSELLWADDISRRGLSVHTENQLAIGERARIMVFLFEKQTGAALQAHAMVRVVSCVFDSVTQDFRVGMQVDRFIGDAETVFAGEIDRITQCMESDNKAYPADHHAALKTSYPLHRRIKLSLDNGELLTGWTENVSTKGMKIALDKKLDKASIHQLTMPIVLAERPQIIPIHAKARVLDLIFRPMGDFAIHFAVYDFQEDGLELLRQELDERFPEISQKAKAPTPEEPDTRKDEDTEVLPSLGGFAPPKQKT